MVYDSVCGVISVPMFFYLFLTSKPTSAVRKLNIKKKFSYKVSRLDILAPVLTNAVSAKLVITKKIITKFQKEDGLFVPYNTVDDIIQENFAKSPATSYTIYIFALNISSDKPYRYTQVFFLADFLIIQIEDVSDAIERCPTTVWAGESLFPHFFLLISDVLI